MEPRFGSEGGINYNFGMKFRKRKSLTGNLFNLSFSVRGFSKIAYFIKIIGKFLRICFADDTVYLTTSIFPTCTRLEYNNDYKNKKLLKTRNYIVFCIEVEVKCQVFTALLLLEQCICSE